jgi:hypothetical protein
MDVGGEAFKIDNLKISWLTDECGVNYRSRDFAHHR